MARSLVCALLVALVVPLAATASPTALPAPGTVLGGGFEPAKISAPGLTLLALHMADAKHVDVWVTPFVSKCAGGPVVFRAPVAADGTFRGVYKNGWDKASGAYGDGGGPITYSGRFSSPTKATGTIRLVWAEGATDCDSGTISWTASASKASASGSAAPSALYAGTTSQRSKRAPVQLPLLVRVAPDGRTATASAYINTLCHDLSLDVTSGGFYAGPGMKIGADGSFAERSTFSDTSGKKKIAFTSTLKGRFGRTAVSGTWRMDAVVTAKATGKRIDTCTSGTLTWSAVR